MKYESSYARIEKVRENLYRFVVQDRFRQINELADDPKLLTILAKESLLAENGEPISTEEIMSRLINAKVGDVMSISLVKKLA
jgi:hypothetical protein